jgi:hypothetical protein
MRRRLVVCSMFALFGYAYATLDRLPRSAASLLRGGTEFVVHSGPAVASLGPES